MVGANCACGLFHPSNTQCPFSMFWGATPQYMQPSPNNYQTTKPAAYFQYDEPTENYYSSSDYYYSAAAATASPPSSVDCTLSLGTPSTRLSNAGGDAGHGRGGNDQQQHRPRRSVSNFCWDLLHPNKSSGKSSANGHNTSSSQPAVAADPLVARRCANCDTTSTPLWRNGPRGPKSLCNACGIRYKKEERRAAANSTNNHHHHATHDGFLSWRLNVMHG